MPLFNSVIRKNLSTLNASFKIPNATMNSLVKSAAPLIYLFYKYIFAYISRTWVVCYCP